MQPLEFYSYLCIREKILAHTCSYAANPVHPRAEVRAGGAEAYGYQCGGRGRFGFSDSHFRSRGKYQGSGI